MMPSNTIPPSFLDILFANRNKAYGAYALRVNYANRLWLSLGAALSVAGFFVIAALLYEPSDTPPVPRKKDTVTVIIDPGIVQPKPPAPPPVSTPPRSQRAAVPAQIKYNTIKLVPDHIADHIIPAVEDLTDKQPGNFNNAGESLNGQPIMNGVPGGEGQVAAAVPVEKPFVPDQQEPEFPGGQSALVRFLQKYLIIPDQLEAGEKKMVRARFMVDAQGVVSLVEITETGGNVFDREVIRVCKKMPRWKPAIQNGVPVSRSYVLPVTFVGVEQ
ncbi:MAG: energy transducer TonB [Sphingobacteriales bacterium]|nr:energy transducer TonB [Sphingobacteriales bacterium]OJW38653.1 MAG: hypothetical protein BGO54_13530 [Sphingobacteriales bacterium 46-32]